MENRSARELAEVIRDEMVFKDRIVALLGQGPKTIAEIAAALESPSHEVMYWVMAMWRYGILVETGKPDDDGYYRYKIKE